MTDDGEKQSGRGRGAPEAERQERLAAALRRNLGRRKAQGRARKANAEQPATGRGPDDPRD